MPVEFGSGVVWHGHAELHLPVLNQWFLRTSIGHNSAVSTNGRLPCRLRVGNVPQKGRAYTHYFG